MLGCKSGLDFKKAKKGGAPFLEIVIIFQSVAFYSILYASGFQRAINELFPIPFCNEIMNLNKVALKNRLEIPKSKNRWAHHFGESWYFSIGCFLMKSILRRVQRAIMELFLVSFRWEIFNWTNFAPKIWPENSKSKNGGPHYFWSFRYLFNRLFSSQRYI